MASIFKRKRRDPKTGKVRVDPRWLYKVQLPNGTWQTRRGFTDKRATEQRAASEQAAIDRGEAGLADPFDGTKRTPLADLAAEFGKGLRAKKRAPRYVDGLLDRLSFAFEVTGARFLQDLDQAAVERFLGQLIRGEDLPPRKPRSATERPEPRGPVSMRTRDTYVEALRAFGAWLHESDRWAVNHFARLRKEARESDRTMEHRALTAEDLQVLVEAAEVRPRQQWLRGGQKGGSHARASQAKLEDLDRDGFARGSLYLFAAYTGLRVGECRAVRRADLVLEGNEPHVVVRAATAKNRTEQRVPLVPLVVDRLRDHLRRHSEAQVRSGGRVPDGAVAVFEVRRGLLASLRKDAEWAGLGLHDPAGRRLTFHGFRASTATLLARMGVSAAVAMRVLRHADARLTLRTYAKFGLGDVHRELREKGFGSRDVAPQVAPRMVPLRAAVGCSVPLNPQGGAVDRSSESPMAPGLAPFSAASCRSVPLSTQARGMVGVTGVEPATTLPPTRTTTGLAAGEGGRGTTGGTTNHGDAATVLIATLAAAARDLLAAGVHQIPDAVRGDLVRLLDAARGGLQS